MGQESSHMLMKKCLDNYPRWYCVCHMQASSYKPVSTYVIDAQSKLPMSSAATGISSAGRSVTRSFCLAGNWSQTHTYKLAKSPPHTSNQALLSRRMKRRGCKEAHIMSTDRCQMHVQQLEHTPRQRTCGGWECPWRCPCCCSPSPPQTGRVLPSS